MSVTLRRKELLICMLRNLSLKNYGNFAARNSVGSKEASLLLLKTRPTSTTNAQIRNYFPTKLPFEWRPLVPLPDHTPQGSGDKEGLPRYDPKAPTPLFEKTEELKTANDDVKKIFSLEFSNSKELREKHLNVLMDRVKRHPFDTTSMEAYIARLTCGIRNMQRHMEIFPKDSKVKQRLLKSVHKRRKKLKLMRLYDYDRFVFLIEKLNLTYTPPCDRPEKITRKGYLRQMTKEHCEKLKHDEILKYSKELKDQQAEFLEEKKTAMQWIAEEEKKAGLERLNESIS